MSTKSVDNQNSTEVRTEVKCQDTPDEAKESNSISLLEIEQSDGDVEGFIGCKVEVRNLKGIVKFTGTLISYDSLNGSVKVADENDEIKSVAVREAFAL